MLEGRKQNIKEHLHDGESRAVCQYMVRRSSAPPPPVGGMWGPLSPVVWLWVFGV